ncbi:unnamed protein product [Didymodactylos carnosus]|uniref:Magnesium transporter NIPA2 n=1 Tax=Didymodactylos carnosus TaxID=1234261 RepID=A0A813XHV7_9BILA|nr:unnamed protein product [Didymodactylos carnosus]CAF1157131.1 unnamed protein product [Didymodactylos carnosus]CAF3652987.1 unnamed protein product [Didymodactylos carnosus]CAF3968668.1 unnamed protein product [Didymodactylos carnosus]
MVDQTFFVERQADAAQNVLASITNDYSSATNKNGLTINSSFYIGISLAVLSSVFIGSSFILKKKGLLKLSFYNGIRAGQGGYQYLREWIWWGGLITMGIGELCNFAAYGFAPASMVTPLGALSVLVSALLAVRYLGEKLSGLSKIGCLLTVFGSIIIVIHAPKESEVNSLLEFSKKIHATEFILFTLITIVSTSCLIIYYGPRSGQNNVLIYILICSLLGAFTVTGCKGLAVGCKEYLTNNHTYSQWLTLFCAFIIIVCIIIQMNYLNKALDLFPTPIVTTVYYVLFTTCVLITSGILFKEWRLISIIDIFGCLIGFGVTTCGLVLINYLKSPSTLPTCNGTANDDILSQVYSNVYRPIPTRRDSSNGNNKQLQDQQQSKGHSLLLDHNEQRQPMLLANERDFA